jgi:hypothetical protein
MVTTLPWVHMTLHLFWNLPQAALILRILISTKRWLFSCYWHGSWRLFLRILPKRTLPDCLGCKSPLQLLHWCVLFWDLKLRTVKRCSPCPQGMSYNDSWWQINIKDWDYPNFPLNSMCRSPLRKSGSVCVCVCVCDWVCVCVCVYVWMDF